MEYSFQNSPREGVTTIILNNYAAIIRGVREEYIPYANITGVRLSRFGRYLFKLHLYQDGLKTIVITSRKYDPTGSVVEQTQAYHKFVHEIHQHLSRKSQASYTYGSSRGNIFFWAVFFLVLTFTISFTANYFGLSFTNTYLEGIGLWMLSMLGMVSFHVSDWPRRYLPTNIPAQFMP